MENFDKLFVHFLTDGVEHYRDSKTALKKIYEILGTDEETLYKNLQGAFSQANRLNMLEQFGEAITEDSFAEGINTPDIPKDSLDKFLRPPIEIPTLKKIIQKQILNTITTK